MKYIKSVQLVYRAVDRDLGCIYEGYDLKSVYQEVLRMFKKDMHCATYYDFRFCIIKQTLVVVYSDNEVDQVHDINLCSVFVSGFNHDVHCIVERMEV